MDRKQLSVTGMSCTHCEENVENALKTLDGVNRADADHEADAVDVVVADDVPDEAVETAVRDAGYDLA